VTTRGAFHRQGLFVGSGGLYGPGPATATLDRLSANGGTRWTTLSRHPESWPVLHRFPLKGVMKADTPASFHRVSR